MFSLEQPCIIVLVVDVLRCGVHVGGGFADNRVHVVVVPFAGEDLHELVVQCVLVDVH